MKDFTDGTILNEFTDEHGEVWITVKHGATTNTKPKYPGPPRSFPTKLASAIKGFIGWVKRPGWEL